MGLRSGRMETRRWSLGSPFPVKQMGIEVEADRALFAGNPQDALGSGVAQSSDAEAGALP